MTRIKECLARIGQTQKWLAVTMGVKQPSVHDWITGKNTPSTENLKRLSELFGVSSDYLLGISDDFNPDFGETDPDTLAIRERYRRDPAYRLLFDAAENAKPEHLRAAAVMLKSLEGKENAD